MKSRIASALVVLSFICVFYFSTGPSARDFCLGANTWKISRVEVKGQMRMAVLSDPTALGYLVDLPKGETLPGTASWEVDLTFIGTLYDKWGRNGSMPIMIGRRGIVLECLYTKTLFGITEHVFIVTNTNAPPKLKEMLTFLLDER